MKQTRRRLKKQSTKRRLKGGHFNENDIIMLQIQDKFVELYGNHNHRHNKLRLTDNANNATKFIYSRHPYSYGALLPINSETNEPYSGIELAYQDDEFKIVFTGRSEYGIQFAESYKSELWLLNKPGPSFKIKPTRDRQIKSSQETFPKSPKWNSNIESYPIMVLRDNMILM